MRVGVLAMFDALGFKGIWARPGIKDNPNIVIEKLLELERTVNEMLDREFSGRERAIQDPGNVLGQCSVAFLSDTVVLGLAMKPAEALAIAGTDAESNRAWPLLVAARFSNLILRSAVTAHPALAYRGCITYGEFALERNFIVGRAVDVAAESMDSAQGAFVWLTPEASSVLADAKLSYESRRYHSLIPYRVPLKGGDEYETHVISPFNTNESKAERDLLTAAILKPFSGSIEVEIKKQRTAQFLQFASDALEAKSESNGPASSKSG